MVPEGREGLYRSWGDAGAELEVLEFLWALVRGAKPKLVWESGGGRSSMWLAMAVNKNRMGQLVVWERAHSWAEEIRDMLVGFERATVNHQGIPLPWEGHADTPDMVFLDSGSDKSDDVRIPEIEAWLAEPVLLAVHDSRDYERLLRDEGGFTLRTPRGLWFRDRRG